MLGFDRALTEATPLLHRCVLGLEAVMHRHGCYELLYVRSGEMDLWTQGRSEHLEEGDWALLLPGALHSYRACEGAVMDLWMWDPALLGPYALPSEDRFPSRASVTWKGEEAQACADTLNRLAQSCCFAVPAADPKAPLEMPSDLFAFRGAVFGFFARFFYCRPMLPRSKKVRILERIMDYVEENYKASVSMSVLADRLGYERHYLSRFFRSSVEMHFTTYVDCFRVEESLFLLSETNLPIATVAAHCGFGSTRSFDRVFLQLTGETPSAYQERMSRVAPQ